jgi:rhamnosyl/mannosyltransferase
MHDLARSCVSRGDAVRAIVASERPWPTRRTLDGVDVIGVATFGQLQGVPIAPTYLARRRRDGEVVHLHEAFPLGTLTVLLGRAGPLVVTWHMDVFRQRALRPLHSALAAQVLERATVIHVADAAVAERSPVLAPFRERVRAIPYIVDVARFARADGHPVALRIRAWAAGEPVGLFVGRFVYYKGLDVLLDALARTSGVRLVLVGGGPFHQRLRARAEHNRLSDRVLWLGAIGDDDLVGAYSGADFFILPSTLPIEAFGIVQVEAMAAGLPVISTRLGTGVEAVNSDGRTGIIVAPSDATALADAIRALAEDTDARRRLAAVAFERAAEFAPERLIDRYRALYTEAQG